MSDKTGIEWTDATWNPVTGCTKVSPGCDNCYAETFAERWRVPGHAYERGFDLTLRPERIGQPLLWTRPRRIFVNSMSDLFHDGVPDEYIAMIFAVMAATPRHTYQLLTKRHGRMRSLVAGDLYDLMVREVDGLGDTVAGEVLQRGLLTWPLRNVWLGVSVEDQKRADLRVPALLDTPAAVRFLSCEPLLGPLDLRYCGGVDALEPDWVGSPAGGMGAPHPLLDWVIVGGESGPRARPMHPAWARSIRDQCVDAGVAFHFKQWGEHVPATVEDDPQFTGGRAFNDPRGGRTAAAIRERGGPFRSGVTRPIQPGDRNGIGVMLDADTIAVRVGKSRAGRELDGRTWDEYPTAAT